MVTAIWEGRQAAEGIGLPSGLNNKDQSEFAHRGDHSGDPADMAPLQNDRFGAMLREPVDRTPFG